MYDIIKEKQHIQRCFNKATESYEAAAIIQKHAAINLLLKLNDTVISPHRVLDLGSGTGYTTRLLTNHYHAAEVIGIDFASCMVNYAKKICVQDKYVCADFDNLPFADNNIDLIFSSMALQWSLDTYATLTEWHRVLRHNGLLLVCMIGKNSLYELQRCFDQNNCVNFFMHNADVTKTIIDAGFEVIGCEVKPQKIFYPTLISLLHGIKSVGANHVVNRSRKTMLTKKNFINAEEKYHQFAIDGLLPITYELCYVTAKALK